ncbi:reverse transcriptase domain protein [Colletotrichum tofieldiae]|nr:reverse transcriptase domain protein [Colletotrichum tofieldiae]
MESSKVTQKLTSDADWTKWYGNLKLVARIHEVWNYIDPDQQLVNTRPRLTEPSPEAENFTNELALAKARHADRMEDYKRANKGIIAVLSWVTSTVEAQYINHVSSKESLREMIIALRDELAPDNYARQQLILRRYQAHMGSIKRSKLSDWLSNYIDIMDEVVDVGLPALLDPTTQVADFLKAVEPLAPSYYTTATFSFNQNSIKKPPKAGEKCAGIQQANFFRQWVRSFHPDWLFRDAKASSFATWQGEDEKGNLTESRGKRNEIMVPKCPACLGPIKHWVIDCPHFNPEKRKPNYDPNHPQNKKAIEQGQAWLKKNLRAQERLNNARVSSSASSDKQATQSSPPSDKENSGQRSSYFNQDQSDSDRDTDHSSDSSSFYAAPNSAPPVSLYAGFPLRNSVIVDSGTGFHICNNRSRMKDLDFSQSTEFTTGGGRMTAIARGTMKIRPNQGGLRKKGFVVRDAWYCPDYPVTLIGAEPLKEKGLIFTVRHPGLETRTGEVLYHTP